MMSGRAQTHLLSRCIRMLPDLQTLAHKSETGCHIHNINSPRFSTVTQPRFSTTLQPQFSTLSQSSTGLINHGLVFRDAAALPAPALCRSAVSLTARQKPSMLQRVKNGIGWLGYSKSRLKRTGYILYEQAADNSLNPDFFKVCELPDTFNSWFLVMELHVWMVSARLMAEGAEGRFTRNAMLEALWQDAEARAKKVGKSSPGIRQQQLQDIGSSFQAAMFNYDEGIQSDDHVLASAVWRRLFSRECDQPEKLECVVQFVRRQMALMDGLSREEILLKSKVLTWVPLSECVVKG